MGDANLTTVVSDDLALPLGPDAATPAQTYVLSLSTRASQNSAKWALRACLRHLAPGAKIEDWWRVPWHTLDVPRLTLLRATLAAAYPSPASANLALAGLRGTLKAAWRMGLTDQDTLARQVDALASVGGERADTGRALSVPEQRALLASAAAQPGLAGPMYVALLVVLIGCGLRRSEVGLLTLASWLPDANGGLGALRVLGKGNKQVDQPTPAGVREALSTWIAVRGPDPGPLFPTLSPNRRHWSPRGIGGDAVYELLSRLAEASGIGDVHPHDLRRTYATTLLRGDKDLATVQKLMRHASPETTARYDKRGKDELAAAAQDVLIPLPR